ncbi:MAG: DAK2 domain-containing protein [Acidobacteriota bacterium]|nr:DAK2 domain-containing protein [Acidobacteriota bacterium]
MSSASQRSLTDAEMDGRDDGGATTLSDPWPLRVPAAELAGANNLSRFRAAVAGALHHLESRRQEVNDLNVFPVADGDTGDNMALTLRAVLDELDRLQGGDESRTVDEVGREELVQSVARAALLGARGNSGVILSQLIRGAAEELISRPGELIDPALIGAALLNAANCAYESVRDPAEGTILTVAREMAGESVACAAHNPQASRLGPEADARTQDSVIARALESAVGAGQDSVKRGPQLLAALREAGVVDAGAYGLTIIFAGVVAALRGEEPPALEHHAPARVSHPEHQSSTYRYCTNFAVTGRKLAPGPFLAPLEELGDSVLVVGDSRTLKVHIHTDDPEHATAVFADAGTISHLDVADMRVQEADRSERLRRLHGVRAPGSAPRARCGAVAVANGEGMRALFTELGVYTIDGGPTLNPSTYDLLAAIHAVEAEEVVVLPCSPNVIMAAERAAELSDKEVAVVDATTQQGALAAVVALVPGEGVAHNTEALSEALARIRTGGVAEAARDDTAGRFSRGDAVGLIGEETVCWGDPAQALVGVLASVADGAEIVSVFAGASAPLSAEAVEELLEGRTDADVELRDGGQEAYWWLVAAE